MKQSEWKPEEKQFYIIYHKPEQGMNIITGGYDNMAEAEAKAEKVKAKGFQPGIIFADYDEITDNVVKDITGWMKSCALI